MSRSDQTRRLMEYYKMALEDAPILEDNIQSINYYGAYCKAGYEKFMFKMADCNMVLFRYVLNGKDGILIIFSIPVQNSSDSKEPSSHSSIKLIELLNILENAFIKVDHMACEEIKEDKFIYLTAFIKSAR